MSSVSYRIGTGTLSKNYYTPPVWTDVVVEAIGDEEPRGILDPSVGEGALLSAAAERFPGVPAFGIDIDGRAVAKVRARMPASVLSVADALNSRSVKRTRVWMSRSEIDVIVANPPFQGEKRSTFVTVKAFGSTVRSGVAPAHVVSILDAFRPKRMVAIVPASMLHSHRDEGAVALLDRHYSCEVIESIGSRCFSGTFAAAEVIRVERRVCSDTGEGSATAGYRSGDIDAALVRGGLAVHAAELGRGSIRFLHSTGLGSPIGDLSLVEERGRGVVDGFVVCVPRVGFPNLRHLAVCELRETVQLSDCVIAVCFEDLKSAQEVVGRIRRDFVRFRGCWAGTGAAYTTIRKVVDYLASIGVRARTDRATSHNGA